METNRKLQIACDLACAFDAVPEAGYNLKDLQDIYKAYKEYFIGIDIGEVSFEEFRDVIAEYADYDKDSVNYEIRNEYFNS